MSYAIQKLNYKANCKTPFFHSGYCHEDKDAIMSILVIMQIIFQKTNKWLLSCIHSCFVFCGIATTPRSFVGGNVLQSLNFGG
jgi:hypothetical protein